MSFLSDNITKNNLSSTIQNKPDSLLEDSKYSSKQKEVSVDKITYKFNVILVGDTSVGKTSILNRFIGKQFSEQYECTISVNLQKKSILLDPYTAVELNIWDTCGQEKYKALTKQYYKNANGVALLFDINDKKTFDNLLYWVKDIYNFSNKNISIIIVGNKSDLERNVSDNDIENFTKINKLNFIQVSAKNGLNIELLFEKLAKEMFEKNKNFQENEESKIKLSNSSIIDDNKSNKNNNTIEKKSEKEVSCC